MGPVMGATSVTGVQRVKNFARTTVSYRAHLAGADRRMVPVMDATMGGTELHAKLAFIKMLRSICPHDFLALFPFCLF
jgi:hypothetical protein